MLLYGLSLSFSYLKAIYIYISFSFFFAAHFFIFFLYHISCFQKYNKVKIAILFKFFPPFWIIIIIKSCHICYNPTLHSILGYNGTHTAYQSAPVLLLYLCQKASILLLNKSSIYGSSPLISQAKQDTTIHPP